MKLTILSIGVISSLLVAGSATARQVPSAPAEPAFTLEQRATIGAAFLGLTPDVLVASGLTADQAASLDAAVSAAGVYEQLIAYAREVDRERQVASVQQVQPPVRLADGRASAGRPTAAVPALERFLTGWLSAAVSTVVIVDGLGATSARTAEEDGERGRPGGARDRSIDGMAAMAASSEAQAAGADPQRGDAGREEGSRLGRLDAFRARLRAKCLESIPRDRAELVESCFQAKMDGIAPQYGVSARTPEQRAVLRDALRAETDSRLEGQPLELKHTEVLRAARRSPEFARAQQAIKSSRSRQPNELPRERESGETAR